MNDGQQQVTFTLLTRGVSCCRLPWFDWVAVHAVNVLRAPDGSSCRETEALRRVGRRLVGAHRTNKAIVVRHCPPRRGLSGPDVGYGPLNAVADGSRAWGWCQGVEVVRDPLDAPLGGPRHGQPAIRGIRCGSCVHLVFSETGAKPQHRRPTVHRGDTLTRERGLTMMEGVR
jgi:hypothetical protein